MAVSWRLLGAGAVLGVAAAGAAVMLLPVIAPQTAANLRPLARRALVEAALAARGIGRRIAEAGEHWEDFVAEVQMEMSGGAAPANDQDTAPEPRKRPRRAPRPGASAPRRRE